MENELELKWRRIQQAMRQEEADGCLLTMNMNLYYVSGTALLVCQATDYTRNKSGTCYPETGTNTGLFSGPESGNAPEATS